MSRPGRLRGFLTRPFLEPLAALDRLLDAADRPWLALGLVLAVTAATWLLYVPLHELLHAAGCLVSGGEVNLLEIAPLYGGALLERWLSFVRSGGDYAGRLSGFTTGRSDMTYLVTVAAPYILSVLGVALLRRASRRCSAALLGLSLVLTLAPFVGLTGDYYEMGSILISRTAAPLQTPPEPAAEKSGLMRIRGDDLPELISRLRQSPETFARGVPGGLPTVILAVALSFLAGALLALATSLAGHLLAARLLGEQEIHVLPGRKSRPGSPSG